jgi:tRNA (guanine37-N1)-methyltransferase
MRFDIITIFPGMFGDIFSGGIVKKALDKGLLKIRVHDLRDYTFDKHRQVDDRPFGGRQGMVLKAEPIFKAVEDIRVNENAAVLILSPQGRKFNSCIAEKLATCPQIILICGRYEGVDERVISNLATDEISIGDYILSGGEPAAVVVIDAVARFVPEVVGKEDSIRYESFTNGMLDYPQYTRPRDFRGMKVPEVLFSGDHQKIENWRKKMSLEKTFHLRPDLLSKKKLTLEDKKILDEILKKKRGKNHGTN